MLRDGLDELAPSLRATSSFGLRLRCRRPSKSFWTPSGGDLFSRPRLQVGCPSRGNWASAGSFAECRGRRSLIGNFDLPYVDTALTDASHATAALIRGHLSQAHPKAVARRGRQQRLRPFRRMRRHSCASRRSCCWARVGNGGLVRCGGRSKSLRLREFFYVPVAARNLLRR